MSASIPFYDLYGESFIRKDVGLAHVEDIAFRSRGLGWEIEPHRHDKLTQIICTFDDSWVVQLDDKRYELSGNWLVLIPAGVVHGFVFEPNIQGYVVSLNQDALEGTCDADPQSTLPELLWVPSVIEFRDRQQIERFMTYIKLLKDELVSAEAEQGLAINRLVQMILLTVKRQQHLQAVSAGSSGRESKVLLAFRHLIEQNYTKHLSVQDYAKQLHVSVSTLNRLCQGQLNESPKSIIHQRLISEAKRRLIYTRQSVEEIAYTLGYKEPGYFSRFFKLGVGMSAGMYRKTSVIS
ncbi:MAG: AraC family transcriptional regulator [Alteromonadaceae bacterium]|jgi:AraC family transcriptional activator of pobA|uniref:helix-turn-helix domain-containing protein n=1 Tax=Paraglaciecola chathamensis TaxID=368405 RepID=UPI000C4D838B|nr:helix-turn-helix domain-containing protein [Paraglaciecola agarilytica]MBN24869.1 AraC family transcriptional regulator [Alteromonadaceae bacterium]|tara:strand:+ start:2913 stop:3794 length:882 start_codon:yes stop_codon:yes gene_type:complete